MTQTMLLPARAEVGSDGDLDARIRAAELRVVARDEHFRSRASHLLQRTRHAMSPRRLGSPLAGAAAAGLALWWLVSRRRAPAHTATHTTRSASPLPWTHLLPLVWPLVPAQWRSRISPGTAAALASVVLPLIGRAMRRRGKAPAVADHAP